MGCRGLRRRRRRGGGVLVFSQYIETRHAAGVGYLLKDRVADVEEFVDALSRVATGGTALDPQVVTEMMRGSRRADGIAGLTARERDVLALMAEGHSNGAIAETSSSPNGRWRSTSPTSSASWGSLRRMPCTAGCEPFSATWSPDLSPFPGH